MCLLLVLSLSSVLLSCEMQALLCLKCPARDLVSRGALARRHMLLCAAVNAVTGWMYALCRTGQRWPVAAEVIAN